MPFLFSALLCAAAPSAASAQTLGETLAADPASSGVPSGVALEGGRHAL